MFSSLWNTGMTTEISAMEAPDGVDDRRDLAVGELREDGQAQEPRRGGLRDRERAGSEAPCGARGLEVKRDRVMHERGDPSPREVREQLVPAIRQHGKEMMDGFT